MPNSVPTRSWYCWLIRMNQRNHALLEKKIWRRRRRKRVNSVNQRCTIVLHGSNADDAVTGQVQKSTQVFFSNSNKQKFHGGVIVHPRTLKVDMPSTIFLVHQNKNLFLYLCSDGYLSKNYQMVKIKWWKDQSRQAKSKKPCISKRRTGELIIE